MDMEQKQLVNRVIFSIIFFLSFSCNDINTSKMLGQKVNLTEIEQYSDNADVCKLKIFKVEEFNPKKFDTNYSSISINNIFEKDNNWHSVGWQKDVLSKEMINFVSPNFVNYDINKIIGNKQNFYTAYQYKKGSNNEFSAIILYLFIPQKKILYNYEIIP